MIGSTRTALRPAALFPGVQLALAAALLLALPGCAALEELAALRSVTFAFAGISDVRLAGIPIGPTTGYSSLGAANLAQLAAAIVAREVPLEMVAHVSGSNPPDNRVRARMTGLEWTLFVDDRRALAGGLDQAIVIEPGQTADVPLEVRFDLLSLGGGGARDLFDLARAVAGQGSTSRELRLELLPTIETTMGPIRYPAPVVVRRAASGG